jgi:predicted DNA-binding transcriptional regulator AlpA
MPKSNPTPADKPAATLVDVRAVAAVLGCSTRHVSRMADTGQMPPPVRLGALVRWPSDSIDNWIASGCKPVRTASESSEESTTDQGSCAVAAASRPGERNP